MTLDKWTARARGAFPHRCSAAVSRLSARVTPSATVIGPSAHSGRQQLSAAVSGRHETQEGINNSGASKDFSRHHEMSMNLSGRHNT